MLTRKPSRLGPRRPRYPVHLVSQPTRPATPPAYRPLLATEAPTASTSPSGLLAILPLLTGAFMGASRLVTKKTPLGGGASMKRRLRAAGCRVPDYFGFPWTISTAREVFSASRTLTLQAEHMGLVGSRTLTEGEMAIAVLAVHMDGHGFALKA